MRKSTTGLEKPSPAAKARAPAAEAEWLERRKAEREQQAQQRWRRIAVIVAGIMAAGLLVGGAYVWLIPRLLTEAGAAKANAYTLSPEEAAKFITTPSGLKYYDEEIGTGDTPQKGQVVTLDYTVWLMDGTELDSTARHSAPIQFKYGAGQVIKGWEEGVATMKVGGKRMLIVPPDLGYGPTGDGRFVPPNTTLRFEIQLVSVMNP